MLEPVPRAGAGSLPRARRPAPPTLGPTWLCLLVTAGAAVGMISTFALSPLHGDVRYEVGVKAVSQFSAAETFTHRPLAFRLLMDSVADLAAVLSFGVTSFEVIVRLIGLGLAIGASVLLWHGLRRRVDTAGLHALVAGAAVVFMGTASSLEPDWMATLFAMAGTGVALAGPDRRRWPMAALAGLLFVAAAAMKIVTLPTALVGLLVVGVLDRRQFLRSSISSVVIGVLYILGTVLWAPWEITWLVDIRLLQPDVLARLSDAPVFFLESAAQWPAIMLFPAALALVGHRERSVLAAAALLAAAPVVLQGQYWAYHGATLCVVAAVAVFRAFRGRVTTRIGISVLAIVIAGSLLTATSTEWYDNHVVIWGAATVGASLVAVGWALAVRSDPPTRDTSGRPVAALVTLALLYPAMTPFASDPLRGAGSDQPPVPGLGKPSVQELTGRQIRQRIGGSTPVTYLTFGSWPYFIRNPTACRYPSPLFLQRTRYTAAHLESESYAENLECVDESTSQWLIVDRRWFKMAKAPPELQARLAAAWDCEAGFRVDELSVCPRAR